MKRYYSLFFMISIFSLLACGSDDDKPSYNFKDQNAMGEIEGDEFVFDDGFADDIDQPLMRVVLTEAQTVDLCQDFAEGNTVLFYVKNSVGLSRLKFEEGHTVTFYIPEGSVNIVSTEGAVEITEITDTHVSGRIDARRLDIDTRINGNFTVQICQQ